MVASKQRQVKISQTVCDSKPFLCALTHTKSIRKRKRLLRKATTNQLLAIAEICLNIVQSRFQLTTRQKKRLLPYANFVRRMSRVRSERGARQLLYNQTGEGLPGLFAALITPILVELAQKVI